MRRWRENNNDVTSTPHRPYIDPIKTIKMRRRRKNNRNEEEEEEEEGKTIEMRRRNKKHWGGKIIKIVEEGIKTLRRENNKIVEKGIKKLSRAIKLKRERGK